MKGISNINTGCVPALVSEQRVTVKSGSMGLAWYKSARHQKADSRDHRPVTYFRE